MPVKSNLSEMEIFWILSNPKKESVEQLAKRIKTTKNVIQKVLDDNHNSETVTEIKPKNPENGTMNKFAKNKKYGFIGMTQGAAEVADYGNPKGDNSSAKKELPSYLFKMKDDK